MTAAVDIRKACEEGVVRVGRQLGLCLDLRGVHVSLGVGRGGQILAVDGVAGVGGIAERADRRGHAAAEAERREGEETAREGISTVSKSTGSDLRATGGIDRTASLDF